MRFTRVILLLSSSSCSTVSPRHTISAADKHTGTSAIVACGLEEHSNGKQLVHVSVCVSARSICLPACACVHVRAEWFRVHADFICQPLSVVQRATVRQRQDTWTHEHAHIRQTSTGPGMVRMLSMGARHCKKTWISWLYQAFSRQTVSHKHTPYAEWRMTLKPQQVLKLNTHKHSVYTDITCSSRHNKTATKTNPHFICDRRQIKGRKRKQMCGILLWKSPIQLQWCWRRLYSEFYKHFACVCVLFWSVISVQKFWMSGKKTGNSLL